MLYYWDEPGKTKEVIGTDWWFHTGYDWVTDGEGQGSGEGSVRSSKCLIFCVIRRNEIQRTRIYSKIKI
jgi:hypothetical protein